ncbi:WD repeat-containing protein 97 [Gadus chalcogrammus]|uniref:WD repeat-containing protein 97 n=1 Tax=Gadus chalcogrammus TaxID=1042646 RepID=UPI0024C47845|nr:WD repeat-containing protein 97 [Gadus chalcogrammus]
MRRTDPHQSERRPDPVPIRPPSPRVPDFLLQFAEESWFKHLYPQPQCVPTSLSPDGFCWVLLDHLDSPGSRSKREVLVALKTLLLQHLLQEQHAIAQHLLLSLPRHTGALVGEMLTIALQLGGGGYSDVVNLLVLLANQTPSLCQAAGARLEVLGVQGAETWLRPELQSWGRALRGRAPAWRVQQDCAARWLCLWTTKYKDHVRADQRGHASSVDVLNFFCSSRRARQGVPGARQDTVRLSPPPCGPQPIHRLGETHSMLRTRKAAGLALPPLRNRPSLTGFPRVLSFPLPRLNLLPLSCPIGQLDATPPSRRYFLLDQSQPEYYR